MKLRIRGNSVRIRVSQPELTEILDSGEARDSVTFSPSSKLTYGVSVSASDHVSARFGDNDITILLPESKVQVWGEPEEVSLRGEQDIGNGETLSILIEKDFACLVPREGEEQESLFPNPNAGPC